MRTLLATFALLLPTTLTEAPRTLPTEGSAEPTAPPAEDDPRYVTYGTSGGWSIVVDAEGEPECFAMGRFRSGSTMRFGIDSTTMPKSVYIVLSDPKWKGMKADTDYALRVSFGGAPEVPMTATSGEEDATVLTFRFSDPAIAGSFARAGTMTVRRDGSVMARVTLGEPKAALMEMGTCRRDMTVLMDALRDEEGDHSPEETNA